MLPMSECRESMGHLLLHCAKIRLLWGITSLSFWSDVGDLEFSVGCTL